MFLDGEWLHERKRDFPLKISALTQRRARLWLWDLIAAKFSLVFSSYLFKTTSDFLLNIF